jgi:hypothetical protein
LPTDLFDAEPVESSGPWPAPLAEAELLSRVHLRARRIRRRRVALRVLPPAALGMAAVLGLVAITGGAVPTHVITEHPASGPDADQPAGDTSTADTLAPVQGSPKPAPVPWYMTKHPLFTDPTGDAMVLASTGHQEDPSLDITDVDVHADSSGVTASMHLADLSAPPKAVTGGPTSQKYWVTLSRADGYFSLYATRDVNTGAITASAAFWRSDPAGTYRRAYPVGNATASVEAGRNLVTVHASFADMNAALAQDPAERHEAIGPGTPVRPTATTELLTSSNGNGGGDSAAPPTDAAFTYRLGD